MTTVISGKLSAQDYIKLPNATIKYGLLRKKKEKLSFGKWPRRFLILLNDSINVYKDENSKVPNSSFSLKGYNRVKRAESKGQEWCFSICPASNHENKVKTFACLSEQERKEWMRAIKRQLCAVNNADGPDSTILDKFRSISFSQDDGEEYNTIEEAVHLPEGAITELHSDSEEESSSSDSGSGGSHSFLPGKSKSFTLPKGTTYDDGATVCKSSNASKLDPKIPGQSKDIGIVGTEPRVKLPMSRSMSESIPQLPPPRYSDVMDDARPDYVNVDNLEETYEMPSDFIRPTLEGLCTVHDEHPDLEKINGLLKAKKEPGTYLIRKSRKDEQKVLVVLDDLGQCRAYKIFSHGSDITLDKIVTFQCLDDLLKNYTEKSPLPTTNMYLKKGIYG
ncbi:unnamed protein product [Lymnaea stagnalis]|uniref:PH domain-containing protein n=1 Tax=Lymnaea stagnalis TaxID=6523 RepID=A0AAV2HRP6_LYMST